MKTLTAIIVDDEQLARRGLEIRLAGFDDIEIVAVCANGREAIDAVAEHKPNIVFLDIQMPGLDGFAVLEALAGPELPFVVFVTAFDNFAIRAFEANALDYLLKPIDDERLAETIQRIRNAADERNAIDHRERLLKLIATRYGDQLTLDNALQDAEVGQKYSSRLAIRDGRTTACVNVAEIQWIDAARDYMCIHANGRTHVLRGTMKQLEETLDPALFVRIHRSTIVNRQRVAELKAHRNGEFFVRLDCNKELKLSRKYKSNVERIADRL